MANRKTITQYTGPLTVEQAAESITKARANAQSLLADAELLLEHQRWARATALAILSIEEAGKVALIRELLLARDEAELREGWRAYRSHSKKNVLWILPDLAAKGARSFEDLSLVGDPTSDHPQVLESLKQAAFYSDVYGKGRCSSPTTDIPEDFARTIVSMAGLLARTGEGLTSAAELALWVRHMGPVWHRSNWEMSQALAACYQEAEETGMLQSGSSASEMTKFLFGIE